MSTAPQGHPKRHPGETLVDTGEPQDPQVLDYFSIKSGFLITNTEREQKRVVGKPGFLGEPGDHPEDRCPHFIEARLARTRDIVQGVPTPIA